MTEIENTLKNQGYYIEHNYGHGQQYLAFNFYVLTLLAFTFHQLLEYTDKLYQKTQTILKTKREFWERLRQVKYWFTFENWEQMLEFVYQNILENTLQKEPP